MVVQGLVEVIVQTTHVLAARGDQRQQFLPDLAFFVWLRVDLRGDGERIGVHIAKCRAVGWHLTRVPEFRGGASRRLALQCAGKSVECLVWAHVQNARWLGGARAICNDFNTLTAHPDRKSTPLNSLN